MDRNFICGRYGVCEGKSLKVPFELFIGAVSQARPAICGGIKMRECGRYRWIWLGLKVLLTVGLVVFCAGVWPGWLIHTYKMAELYTEDISQTPWLSAGDVALQYFYPEDSRLSKMKIALAFDESAVEGEYLILEIQDETGGRICSREIYFDQIESGCYFDVVVEEKVRPGGEYAWALSLPDEAQLEYAVLCTGDAAGNAVENRVLLINGEDVGGNAINQYEYYAHYDKAVIIGGFWVGALLVWLVLLELTDRAKGLVERKRHDGEK